MTLFTQTLGNGRNVVLLHGWGMHSGLWEKTVDRLAGRFKVTLIDLPGHGQSHMIAGNYDLQTVTAQIATVTPEDAILMGWSLGGIIAMQLACDHPDSISKLILVNSTPQFTQSPDWPDAMDRQILEEFAEKLQNDFETAIKKFIGLQAKGSRDGRQIFRKLNNLISREEKPHADALAGGLNILRETNLRHYLPGISCPVLLIFGEHDRLIPPNVGSKMLQLLPNAQCHVIAKAGHAPFLSHTDEFLRHVVNFIND